MMKNNIKAIHRKYAIVTLTLCIFLICQAIGQQKVKADSIRKKMEWFQNAKLGIFIHWGIYAVNGVDESWAFYNKKISWKDYMAQINGFTAAAYDPDQWATIIKNSGAKYAVITFKHHDGVALWDSKEKHYSLIDSTKQINELMEPFFIALRREGVRPGAYFSLIDWSHPDYPGFTKDSSRYKVAANPIKWEKFRKFYQNQVAEISKKYQPDLWWFDGDWEHSDSEWQSSRVRKMILSDNPKAIINGRLNGYGDYETPEQNLPVTKPSYPWWELCMTLNNNWGYHPSDSTYKTPYEVISIFADVVSRGGNLLLDIAPRADGVIPEEQVYVLKELGEWMLMNERGIYGTRPGLPDGHYYGPSTISQDSTKLYLYIPGNTSGPIMVKGLINKINEISILGTETKLEHKVVGKIDWSPVPGLVYINVPMGDHTKYMTILELDLDGPLNLYKGKGGLK